MAKIENLSSLITNAYDDIKGVPKFEALSKKGGAECTVIQKDILDFGNEGFLLKGILSQEECDYYIKEAEKMGVSDIKMKKEIRNNQRLIALSNGLAEVLYDRIKPYLVDIVIDGNPHDKHIHGIPMLLQGRWKPSNLNPLFRICRYEPGGHFAPHFDGHFSKSSKERSMTTLMLYLNEDFEGGSTNFIKENQELHKDSDGNYCAEEKNIIFKVKPETGMAIIFNHHRLHEGEKLGSNVKWILRTDIMYKRVEGPELTEREEKGIQLMLDAERLEASNDEMGAMELYRKAFKLCPKLEEYFTGE